MCLHDRLQGYDQGLRRAVSGLLTAALAVFLFGSDAPARAAFGALTIVPTFDSTITGDPNAVAIENTITSAINYYDTTFTSGTAAPLTVAIYFKEGGGLGGSNTVLYKIGYQPFISALTAGSSGDAIDTTALANLPTGTTNPVTGTTTINVKSANGRALGFNTPGVLNSSGGVGGSFDGVITLNTSLTTPGSPGSTLQYSLFAVTEHEIDEVLGLGSDVGGTSFFADPAPQDLFRYASTGNRTFTTAGDNAFFSLDGANDLVQFNQNGIGDYGDWHSSSTVRVQDWAGTPGASPTLAADAGQVEVVNLDAQGYNLTSDAAAVPEPAAVTQLAVAALTLFGYGCGRWTRRRSDVA
jgi:hypothetical protein